MNKNHLFKTARRSLIHPSSNKKSWFNISSWRISIFKFNLFDTLRHNDLIKFNNVSDDPPNTTVVHTNSSNINHRNNTIIKKLNTSQYFDYEFSFHVAELFLSKGANRVLFKPLNIQHMEETLISLKREYSIDL